MGASSPTKREQTRERLYQAALGLFLTQGYASTTMRAIAEASDCALGLSYRYFPSKEDFVLELYRRSSVAMQEDLALLPYAPFAQRFELLMRTKIAAMQAYRPLYQAVLGAALSPQHPIGVFSPQTADIAAQAQQVFAEVIRGASDALADQQARDMSLVLYTIHLALLLYWLHDSTAACRATDDAIGLACDFLRHSRRLLRLAPFRHLLGRIVALLEPLITRV